VIVPTPEITIISGASSIAFNWPQQRDAVDVRQHQIDQDDVGPPQAEDFNRARPDCRGANLVSRRSRPLFDDHLQPVRHHRLVVHDEHPAPVCRLQ
jgi:hypothetical protein